MFFVYFRVFRKSAVYTHIQTWEFGVIFNFYSRGVTSGTRNASAEKWLKIHGSSSFSVSLNNERSILLFLGEVGRLD